MPTGGRALYGQVDRLFSGLTQLESFMKDLGSEKQGHLTVASLPLLSLTAMPDVLAAFMADRPNISVALQTRSSARIVEWVAARQVDLGVCFCAANHPGIVAEPLASLQLYCAIPPGDPLGGSTPYGWINWPGATSSSTTTWITPASGWKPCWNSKRFTRADACRCSGPRWRWSW